MSSPTGGVAVNRDLALVAGEYVGVAPGAAGSLPSVAAADHQHKISASSGKVSGFGKMWQTNLVSPSPTTPPDIALFSLAPVTVPPIWTAELWLASDGNSANTFNNWNNGGAIFIGWVESGGAYPVPPNDLGFDNHIGLSFLPGGAGLLWGAGAGAYNGLGNGPGLAPTHVFVQLDPSGNMWVGFGGTVYGPYSSPGGGANYPEAFASVMWQTGGGGSAGTGTISADDIRFSSNNRYPMANGAPYDVPAAPFASDAETLILWHLDDIPYGSFMESNGDGVNVWVVASFTTADSSPNAIQGVFGMVDSTGQSTGDSAVAVNIAGVNSVVGSGAGVGTASTVESIQGATGNFQLVDRAGNVLPLANVGGAQQVSTAIPPALNPPPTNPLVSGTIYQNTTLSRLRIFLGVTATVAGTARWALGPTATPPTWGPAVTVPVGPTTPLTLDVPAGWYFSLTLTGTATIGTASGLSE